MTLVVLHVTMFYFFKVVILHSSVKLPEGTLRYNPTGPLDLPPEWGENHGTQW